MKIFVTFFILIVTVQFTISAQQTDENTLAINNYFQVSQENSNPSNLDGTIQSFTNIVQVGSQNNTYINSLQSGDQQVITQKGHQNNYEYYNYYSQENSNLIITQKGNQNSLQIFGENSLMKDATIFQKSNFKSIVIKNFSN